MPIIKSAKKRVRQAERRYGRNLVTKRTYRQEIKTLEAAIESGDAKKVAAQFVKAQSAVDTAVKKNVLHRNNAARTLRNLNQKIKVMSSGSRSKATSSGSGASTKKTSSKTVKKASKSSATKAQKKTTKKIAASKTKATKKAAK